MSDIGSLNLIHFLDFYFALLFFAGLARRLRQYQSVAQMILAGPGRWPNLLKLVSRYRMIFWTWSTLLPALLALVLWLVQIVMSRLVLPDAGSPPTGLTIFSLLEHSSALFFVVPAGVAMLGWDLYSLYRVGRIDRLELEKYFDQAEFWLRSRSAHVVRVVTLGYINPRRMVTTEVEKALTAVSDLLNFALWWVSLQVGLRFLFGLALWITWAVTQ